MPGVSSVSGSASAPGRPWPSFRDARALIRGKLRGRGWVWWLSMLWVVLGASGAGYAFVCTTLECTTNQCTNDEFLPLQYNGEPWLIASAGGLAASAWLLLAVPLLVAGLVRLRGWRRRNWLRAVAWAGAWVAGFALMFLLMVAGLAWEDGSGAPNVAWGELPIIAAWLALGAAITSVLAKPATRERDVPQTTDRSSRQASW
jgi:hypothetical protein